MNTAETFNLVDEQWIQCSFAGNHTDTVSLRSVFTDPGNILQVRGDSPTQDYAVLRLILAIFWRSHRVDDTGFGSFRFSSWRAQALAEASNGLPDQLALDYLKQNHSRFNLLDSRVPFMQVADLETTTGKTLPVTRIIPEAEGDFFTLRDGRGKNNIGFAEAARWLVHVHAYDYSGIKPGAIGDPRVKGGRGYPIGTGWSGMTGGTTVLGRTLRETLILNSPRSVLLADASDRPVWERDPDSAVPRREAEPAGPSDLATWQSRRVRLLRSGTSVNGVVVCNGDKVPNAGANVFGDPMTPYRWSKNKSVGGRTVYYPLPHPVDRTTWQSLEPLLLPETEFVLANGASAPKRPEVLDALSSGADDLVEVFGQVRIRLTSASYGPNDSVAGPIVDASLDVPLRMFDPEFREARADAIAAAKAAQAAAISLGRFAGDLGLAAGRDYEFQTTPRDLLLSDLEQDFHSWVRSLDLQSEPALDQACVDWQDSVKWRVLDRAEQLVTGAGPGAIIGRVVRSNDSERFVSVATAQRTLKRRLAECLPLLSPTAPPS